MNAGSHSLLCRVQNRLCAVPIEGVIETMRPLPVELLAGASHFVLGLAIIRGEPIPVVDLGRLLNDREESHPGRFVTIRIGERQVALAVDQVLGVRVIPPESLRQLPPLLRDAGEENIGAIGCLDAELLFILRCARILPNELFEAQEIRAVA